MEDGKGNLIAYHLLESSTSAYIEWLVNEPIRLLIKIKYKDARLVMLPANATHKPDSLVYPCSLFFLLSGKSCWVQLSTQGFIPPVGGARWMLELTFVCGFLLVGSARISLRCDRSFYLQLSPNVFINERFTICCHNLYTNASSCHEYLFISAVILITYLYSAVTINYS